MINTTSPSTKLHITGTWDSLFRLQPDSGHWIEFRTGTISAQWLVYSGTAAITIQHDNQVVSGDFNDTSDIGLKENITKINSGLDVVNKLNPVDFDWKNPAKGRSSGFIAQEVETILPNNVSGEDYAETEDDTVNGKAINTIGIVAHLTKAIQELSAKVTALENA